MGHRVSVIFTDEETFGPPVYLHWNGDPDVLIYLDECRDLMDDRRGDIPYMTARFIGICHNNIPGNLSLGVGLNAVEKGDEADCFRRQDPGDCGVIVVNVNTFKARRFINGHRWLGPSETYNKHNEWFGNTENGYFQTEVCTVCGVTFDDNHPATKRWVLESGDECGCCAVRSGITDAVNEFVEIVNNG